MKKNRPFGIIARVACVLLCLVLFSAHLCSGMFARYTTGGEVTSSAPAAALNVTNDRVTTAAFTGYNKYATHTFKVANNSEVAMGYDAVIRFYTTNDYLTIYGSDMLSRFVTDLTIDGTPVTGAYNGKAYEFKLSNAGQLAPGDSVEHNVAFVLHPLTVTDEDLGSSNVYNNMTIPVGFDAYVMSWQID